MTNQARLGLAVLELSLAFGADQNREELGGERHGGVGGGGTLLIRETGEWDGRQAVDGRWMGGQWARSAWRRSAAVCGWREVAEAAECIGIAAPVREHLHPEVEVDRCVDQLLDLDACRASDLADP